MIVWYAEKEFSNRMPYIYWAFVEYTKVIKQNEANRNETKQKQIERMTK